MTQLSTMASSSKINSVTQVKGSDKILHLITENMLKDGDSVTIESLNHLKIKGNISTRHDKDGNLTSVSLRWGLFAGETPYRFSIYSVKKFSGNGINPELRSIIFE